MIADSLAPEVNIVWFHQLTWWCKMTTKKKFLKQTFRTLAVRQSEGRRASIWRRTNAFKNVSFVKSLRWPIYIITVSRQNQLILEHPLPTNAAPQFLSGNLPPSFIRKYICLTSMAKVTNRRKIKRIEAHSLLCWPDLVGQCLKIIYIWKIH